MKSLGTRPTRARVRKLSAQACGVCSHGRANLKGQFDSAEDADALLVTHFYFGMSVSDGFAERATAAAVKGKARGLAVRQSSS